jgi:dTDP-4-dehydrorhamnose reductase
MTYIILGANGLIGQQFVKLCKEKGIDSVGTRYSREKGNLRKIDFLEPGHLQEALEELCPAPAVVVNCVNLAGGVNFCEDNPELARKLHVDAAKQIVDWCLQKKAVFVNFSTDYVFDGKNPPYKEDDETGPLNLYGQLKLESEIYIKEQMKRYIIARTTNVFGWDPDTPTPNFLMYLYQTLGEGKTFNTPSFLLGNPTYAEDLTKAVLELIDKEQFGLFHIVGSGYINRYDWAIKFCEMARLDKDKIIEVKNPPENIVPRPFHSNLNTDKVSKIIETKLHGVDEGLQLLMNEMKKG